MRKYKFRKYNRNFTKQYIEERRRLEKILPNAKIEHIGSTSIENLGGKGIIDVLVGVKKSSINSAKNKLIKAGHTFKLNGGGKGRLFFEKDYTYKGGTRRVHIQLTTTGSKIWQVSIFFRDFLRNNLKARKEYERIKKKAVKNKLEGESYRRFKHNFIKSILKKSKK